MELEGGIVPTFFLELQLQTRTPTILLILLILSKQTHTPACLVRINLFGDGPIKALSDLDIPVE